MLQFCMQFIYNLNPIALNIFGLDIYWYGISYLVSFLLGKIYIDKVFKPNFSTTSFLNYLVIGVIVGGRLGQIFFYDWHVMDVGLWEKMIHRGGMSFHGGLIGAGIACWIYTKQTKVHFWHITDMVAMAAPIGIFFGRIANSINQEILGKIMHADWSNVFWATQYNRIDLEYRHPVTMYEALTEGLLLFIILFFLRKNLKTEGRMTFFFIIGYAVMRFICEFYKQSDWQAHGLMYGLNYGQVLSVGMIICSALIYMCMKRCSKI